ncbi:MAG TPA: phosphoribosyltransferase [Candidatus Woesebacteria bacterium]|nr:phosphoribosyltransferase [Candidatus Woesebacteria bacterium]HQL10865.1 phosphoribosyltransferase [Candidatus Woesebacteria bacterium]
MQFDHIVFDNDPAQYITPSWQDLDQLSFELAKQVIGSGEKFDLVVALAKGAWPMSRALVDYLAMSNLVSLGIRFYSGINQRLKEPEVYQDLPVKVKGKRILLFDDVADTGESLIFASDYLLEQGAALVKTATLFFKERSAITPDYYASRTNAWIIFPFEIREMSQLLSNNWRKQGLAESEINARLKKLNFNEKIMQYFAKIEK